MISPQISIESLAPQPVANFSTLWGKEPATLQKWCKKGWIPTAFQHPCGEWWVKPAHPDFLGFDLSGVESRETVPAKARKSKPDPNARRIHPHLRIAE